MNPYIHTYDRAVTVAAQAKTTFKPKVTVIMPVYQAEDYLAQCLDSILAQTFAQFELICVNDGSADHSLDILLDYAARDSRITVLCQENAGASAARNAALAHACGEYICFVDSDDMLEPQTLSVLSAKADDTQADIIYFAASVFTDDPSLLEKHGFKSDHYARAHSYPEGIPGVDMYRMMRENKEYHCVVWAQFFRRQFLAEHHHVFPENMRYFEDEPFSEICILTARRTVCIPDSLYIRRVRPGSVMTMVWGFLHVYSDFTAALIHVHFYAQHPELQDALPHLWQRAHARITRAKRTYLTLPPEELAKVRELSAEEQMIFRLIIEHPCLEPEISSLKWRARNTERSLNETQRALEVKDQELQRAAQSLAEKNQELQKAAQALAEKDLALRNTEQALAEKEKALSSALHSSSEKEQQLKNAEQALQKRNQEYDAMRRSPSMRIGRAITFLPRKIRDCLRALRAKH